MKIRKTTFLKGTSKAEITAEIVNIDGHHFYKSSSVLSTQFGISQKDGSLVLEEKIGQCIICDTIGSYNEKKAIARVNYTTLSFLAA